MATVTRDPRRRAGAVIIDCHGHYTTAPPALSQYFDDLAALRRTGAAPRPPAFDDDELRASVAARQVAEMDRRGTDVLLISPKASAMAHHVDDSVVAAAWARLNNDVIHRVVTMFPARLVGVCQLPQTPSGGVAEAVAELRRCVEQLGFVGCNLNPDPSGGAWTAPPLTDEFWFPLYQEMVDLDVPAMVHVSRSLRPGTHTLGAHYLNADTTVFMQLVEGRLFERFPGLRFVIPHGGGAAPYHWGRFLGLADRHGDPEGVERAMRNIWFDTCVYHPRGVELLLETVGSDRVLFASELLGAVPGIVDPATGAARDDTRRYLEALDLPATDARRVFELNARQVYPRLDARLGPSR